MTRTFPRWLRLLTVTLLTAFSLLRVNEPGPTYAATIQFAAPANYGVGASPQAVAVGDFNKDGKPDLAVAIPSQNIVDIFLNTGNGTYATGPAIGVADPVALAAGDFNGDTISDLAVASGNQNTVTVLLGTGAGGFQVSATFGVGNNPVAIATGDFNSDGNLDVAVANHSSNDVTIALGKGGGAFQGTVTKPGGQSPVAIVAFVNAFKHYDLAVADQGSSNVEILTGDGVGNFSQSGSNGPVGVPTSPSSITAADVNHDNIADLVVAGSGTSNVVVLLGNSNNTFQGGPAVGGLSSPSSIAAADFDKDGNIDLALSSQGSNNLTILPGLGNGSFNSPLFFSTPGGPVSVAAADVNGDGLPDIVTANANANNVSVLLNGTPQQATPTLTTQASPSAVTLDASGSPVLKDTATLANGNSPTGTITFTLTYNGSAVDTEPVTVSGNGSYSTPTGYMLPTTGPVAGSYTWTASYSGDANNSAVTAAGESVNVNQAQPTLTTIPNPTSTMLGSNQPLFDGATFSGAYFPTGTITFQLYQAGTLNMVFEDDVPVNGNGTYTTQGLGNNPGGYVPTAGGTYQWQAFYNPDPNNLLAQDKGDPQEQVTVTGQPVANPDSYTTTENNSLTVSPPGVLQNDTPTNPGDPLQALVQTQPASGTLTADANKDGGFTYAPASGFCGTDSFTYEALDTTSNLTSAPATVTIQVSCAAVLKIQKVADTPSINPGGSASYTITITNVGSVPAAQVTLTDALPGAGNSIDWQTSQGSKCGIRGTPGNGESLDCTNLLLNGVGAGQTLSFHVSTQGVPNSYCGVSNKLVNTASVAWSSPTSGSDSSTAVIQVNCPATPTVTSQASPATVTLDATGSPVLKDTAALSSGNSPTGSITFTLTYNGSTVDTEKAGVNGNGSYSTPTGYTLPPNGQVTGTYQWHAQYSGDGNNSGASDGGGSPEQTVVTPAVPSLTTAVNAPTVVLGSGQKLNDTADLEGGYSPGSAIQFQLLDPTNAVVYQDVVTVGANGTYSTQQGTNPGGFVPSATGTYTWQVTYPGNANNNPVAAQPEQVTVVPRTQAALTTVASPASVQLSGSGSPTLTDTATLSGGNNPGGSIIFTLTLNGNQVLNQSVPVAGNSSYSASYTLPTNGPVVGSYQWQANYSGDSNNQPAQDQGGTSEQTMVSPASATLTTSATPTAAMLGSGQKLNDMAILAGAYFPGGAIHFTLYAPDGVTVVYQDNVPVSGNGTYVTQQGGNPGGYLPGAPGTYTWQAFYNPDANNQAPPAQPEPVTVSAPATPTLTTTASPSSVTLGPNGAPTLTDTAKLAGGNSPTGAITFTLTLNGSQVFSQPISVPVNGNKAYSANYTLPTNAAVTGTYQWHAAYSGDANNSGAPDGGGTAEQTVVNPAQPTLATAANPSTTVLGSGPKLNDSATLSGGYFPVGALHFMLIGPGNTVVYQNNVQVAGNGTYVTQGGNNPGGYAPTAAGSYTWQVIYTENLNPPNNTPPNGAPEPVTVGKANTTGTISASAAPSIVNQGVTFTATVNGPTVTPTGTVQFSIDGTSFGSPVPLSNGSAVSGPISTLAIGTHSITAAYSGDTNFNASSGSSSQQVSYNVRVLSTGISKNAPTIVLQLWDFNFQTNLSAQRLKVTAVCVVPFVANAPAPTTCANAVQTSAVNAGTFSYLSDYNGSGPSFTYKVSTKGLTPGTKYYQMVQTDGDPALHAVLFSD